MAMIRRFVNIVAESYSTKNSYSLHRLDVSKHLFYPSTAHAVEAAKDGMMTMETLRELPPPCTHFKPVLQTDASEDRSSSTFFFGLLRGARSSEGRILCMDEAGHSMLYDADEHISCTMPSLQGFKPPASVSLSILPQPGAKEEAMYIMHGGDDDGQELNSRFDVLRFSTLDNHRWRMVEAWHWHSLPLPPFVHRPEHRSSAPITSYTVVEGGLTICLSPGEGVGTYCFDTVQGEWLPAVDWVLPFAGRAEYLPNLNLWLGFSRENPRDLCVASGLGAMGVNRPSKLQCLWKDQTPEDPESEETQKDQTPEDPEPEETQSNTMATSGPSILNLGSARFAIAKVFNDGFLLTGVEICRELQTVQHKSIRYMCTKGRIHRVI